MAQLFGYLTFYYIRNPCRVKNLIEVIGTDQELIYKSMYLHFSN